MKRSLVLLTLAGAASAHALIVSGVTNGSIVSPMPGSGPFQVAITGTITASLPGEKIIGNAYDPSLFSIYGPYSIPMTDYSWFDIAAAAVEATGTYTGTLFAYEVSSSTNIGRYDRYPFPDANPPYSPSEHIFLSSLGSSFDATLTGFYVDVNAVAAPEPTSMFALGLGAFALLRRRTRR